MIEDKYTNWFTESERPDARKSPPGGLTCQDCGVVDEEVKDTYCPFDDEVYGKSTPITVCISCFTQRARDV